MEMTSERKWKLGDDLSIEDNLLDGFSIANFILALRSTSTVNPETAKQCLEEILEIQLQDMWYIFQNNIEEIISEALKWRE